MPPEGLLWTVTGAVQGQIHVLSTCSQSLEGKHQTLGVSAVLIIESPYTDKRDSILKSISKVVTYVLGLCYLFYSWLIVPFQDYPFKVIQAGQFGAIMHWKGY